MAEARRPRVMLVDDYEELLKAWRRFLESSCDIVGCLTNGREAVALAAATKPDVVVLDLFLVGANGLDLCREIKRLTPETRVVLVSADDDPDVRKAALALGASAFVSKSSTPQELEQAIQG